MVVVFCLTFRSGSNVYDKAIVSLFPEISVQDEVIDDIEWYRLSN